MKKATIITSTEFGKSTMKAEELVKGKKSLWVDSLRIRSLPQMIDETIDVVVLADVPNFELSRLIKFVTSSSYTFRKPYADKATTIPDLK